MKSITILGATGSIGLNTLDVISRHLDQFQIFALTANSNVDQLYYLCLQYHPRYAVMCNEVAAENLRQRLNSIDQKIEVLGGVSALDFVASHDEVDDVMAAIVGAAGLLPTLAAVRAGKRILLANKESLVMAGGIFMQEVKKYHAQLLPIDSEHNAIFQCLPHEFDASKQKGIKRIYLTASGGPFRNTPLNELAAVTPEQAVAHPNWNMGKKISVDSATMMNKGLEVIEAHWLFGLRQDQIQVLLHPQSVIHSLVEYIDGSTLAQLGNPDMRIPIAHALAWPDRMESGVVRLDLLKVGRLDFEPLNLNRYPCLRLAYQALTQGGTATAILNAANEVAVQSFLEGVIPFTKIPHIIESVLTKMAAREATDLNIILEDDKSARTLALQFIAASEQKECVS